MPLTPAQREAHRVACIDRRDGGRTLAAEPRTGEWADLEAELRLGWETQTEVAKDDARGATP